MPTVITGYTDAWSVQAGDQIAFMVTCDARALTARMLELRHGDLNESGPGFRATEIASPISGSHASKRQRVEVGSFARVDRAFPWAEISGLAVAVWIYPTKLGAEPQGILSNWDAEANAGMSLYVTADARLAVRLANGAISSVCAPTAQLQPHTWHVVCLSFDIERSSVLLGFDMHPPWPVDKSSCWASLEGVPRPEVAPDVPILIGALELGPSADDRSVPVGRNCFNGKIASPVVFPEPYSAEQLLAASATRRRPQTGRILADWDFRPAVGGPPEIRDVSGNNFHARLINGPTPAVPNHLWDGSTLSFRDDPGCYAAIHFHDDDLDDAAWDATFDLTIPEDLPSGVYAAHIKSHDAEEGDDYLPFFVRPRTGEPTARLAVLIPSFTYQAYANERMLADDWLRSGTLGITLDELLAYATPYERAHFQYILDNRLLSCYDNHSDGSGCVFSSILKPIMNFRPAYNKPALKFQGPHCLNNDLYLIDWLKQKRIKFDVLTDHDLHEEGVHLLSGYRTVMTGAHPEYCSAQMLDAIEGYVRRGGGMMYMGANGFYWVTSIDPHRGWLIEIRRGDVGQVHIPPWVADPGASYHATTGEPGGLWRSRARAPQRIFGIGMTGNGIGPARPYVRSAASHDARHAYVFRDVPPSEVIGAEGIHLGGAGGWELDRHDATLGSPPTSVVLATTDGFDESYGLSPEELAQPAVRGDLTITDFPRGGRVFATGSITWSGSLSHNAYAGPISRITENVVREFLGESVRVGAREGGEEGATTQ
jgi:N,N-dimethylformamidase